MSEEKPEKQQNNVSVILIGLHNKYHNIVTESKLKTLPIQELHNVCLWCYNIVITNNYNSNDTGIQYSLKVEETDYFKAKGIKTGVFDWFKGTNTNDINHIEKKTINDWENDEKTRLQLKQQYNNLIQEKNNKWSVEEYDIIKEAWEHRYKQKYFDKLMTKQIIAQKISQKLGLKGYQRTAKAVYNRITQFGVFNLCLWCK